MDFSSFHKNYSSFTCAAADSYSDLVNRHLERYDISEWLNAENIVQCQHDSVNRFLFSFGANVNYKTKKISNSFDESFLKTINTIKNYPHMKDTLNIWDSGGFQISMGAICNEDISKFLTMYYNAVANNSNLFDHFFILDVPPGPGSKDIFTSYQQIEDFNRKSYQMCIDIVPEEIRKNKGIYIHHFRTPSLFKMWNKFLYDENLAEGYRYFGTGGLVANMATGLTIPIILYSIPLACILKYCKQHNITEIAYHVLGGAGFLDLFYHKLFEKHVYETHGIKLHITYDSSSLFKGFCVGRYIHVFDDNENLVKMDIRSPQLHLRFGKIGTVEDKIFSVLNNSLVKYGFKELSKKNTHIYDPATGTFPKHMMLYIFQYLFTVYKDMEKRCVDQINSSIYPAYKSGNIEDFLHECRKITAKLNQGKITKIQTAKCSSLYNSLKIVETLDIKYIEFIVNKFLIADESNVVKETSSSVVNF